MYLIDDYNKYSTVPINADECISRNVNMSSNHCGFIIEN